MAKTNPEKNILKQLFFVFGAGEGADGGDIHIYIIYPRKGQWLWQKVKDFLTYFSADDPHL